MTHGAADTRATSEPVDGPKGVVPRLGDAGARDGERPTGTYLKADGPIPIGVEGVEEEVCVGGGI